MRNPARLGDRDANHAEIVECYEQMLCTVIDTHEVGKGFPDLVVGIAAITHLVEIKTADGDLLPSQERFMRDWRGSPVIVVRTREDVIAHVTSVRAKLRAGWSKE